MPGGDGTGPMGMGPMTGRAAGYCAGYPVPGYANPWMGRGFWGRGGGRGGGRGRGWRHWYYATGLPGWARAGWAPAGGPAAYGAYPPYAAAPYGPAVPANVELDALKSQAEHLRGTLEQIQKRMAELEAEAAKKE